MDIARKRELLERLVAELAAERGQELALEGASADELWQMFRAFVNTRPPLPEASDSFLAAQDELLQGLIAEAGIAKLEDAEQAPSDPRLMLWRGDITTLAVDAIVNAANSQMLGCWAPGHFCIDNAIHTYAGIQLRRECFDIMTEQGHDEPTGKAKITSAWNLPSTYVIHTVGPIANGHATERHREELASSYRSCLEAAANIGARSIGFCCISTGVFGFPAEEACGIAVHTVRSWLEGQSESAPGADMSVIFNVFSEADEDLYREALGMKA